MPLYKVSSDSLKEVAKTTFSLVGVRERQDLQRHLKKDIGIIGEDLMVIAEEFGDWEGANRRIDLLCIDKNANLVVVELKRTDDGGHMDLQAIRYAAMISSMTFDQLIRSHAKDIGRSHEEAGECILGFLEWDSLEGKSLTGEVRIILISADFSKEITTAALWLNRQGLDIACIRVRPYDLEGQILMDVHQIIPLPETAEYEIQIRNQQQEQRHSSSRMQGRYRSFWKGMTDLNRAQAERASSIENRQTANGNSIVGVSNKAGFNFNFALTPSESRVECHFRLASPEQTDAAFRALENQKSQIEKAFGGQLIWQARKGKWRRIYARVEGGSDTPEKEWPNLQMELIRTMVRLEKAFGGPLQALPL